jgi:hypothetical protein
MALPSRDLAEFEMMQLGNSLFELWALSAQNVAIKNPEAFGTVTDRDAWQERLAELKAVRDGLFERIGQEFSPNDTTVGPPRSDGSVFVYFRLAPEVLVHPLHNAAERLVNYLIDHGDPVWKEPLPEEPIKPKRVKTQQVMQEVSAS